MLCELQVKEGKADCFITERNILGVYSCNRSFPQPLNFVPRAFVYTSFSGPSAMSTEELTMNTEQRINLKSLVRFRKTPPQALEMHKQVYGDNTMSLTCVSEWHKRFKEGCEEVEDDARSGSPSTSGTEVNVEWVKQVVHGDRRLTV